LVEIRDLSLEVILKIMDVNFLGGVALTKAVPPQMLEHKQGYIVVISSILGKIVTPRQAAYNASKHTIQGFYDTLRAEVGAEGVKVLIVSSGAVNTNVAKNSLDKEGKPINRTNKMIEKGLSPEFVAAEVLKAIRKEKEEIILAGGKEKFAILMKRLSSALFSCFLSGRKTT
jgi:dehydrogenase/reductase SDR family protein 7B